MSLKYYYGYYYNVYIRGYKRQIRLNLFRRTKRKERETAVKRAAPLESPLKDVRAASGVIEATAVVSVDGLVIAGALPAGVE